MGCPLIDQAIGPSANGKSQTLALPELSPGCDQSQYGLLSTRPYALLAKWPYHVGSCQLLARRFCAFRTRQRWPGSAARNARLPHRIPGSEDFAPVQIG